MSLTIQHDSNALTKISSKLKGDNSQKWKCTSIHVHLSSSVAGAEAPEERGLHQGRQDQFPGALVSDCFLREALQSIARGQFQQSSSNTANQTKGDPGRAEIRVQQ